MEIEVTEKKKVNISFAQRQKVMLQTMKDLAEWKEGMWFDQMTGKMMQTNEYIGSHSFDEESVVREANEMDMAVHLFVLAMNDHTPSNPARQPPSGERVEKGNS